MNNNLINKIELETSYYYHFSTGDVVVVQKSRFTEEQADLEADKTVTRLQEQR